MENLNAVFVHDNLALHDRLVRPNQIAIQQMRVLQEVGNRKLLKWARRNFFRLAQALILPFTHTSCPMIANAKGKLKLVLPIVMLLHASKNKLVLPGGFMSRNG